MSWKRAIWHGAKQTAAAAAKILFKLGKFLYKYKSYILGAYSLLTLGSGAIVSVGTSLVAELSGVSSIKGIIFNIFQVLATQICHAVANQVFMFALCYVLSSIIMKNFHCFLVLQKPLQNLVLNGLRNLVSTFTTN